MSDQGRGATGKGMGGVLGGRVGGIWHWQTCPAAKGLRVFNRRWWQACGDSQTVRAGLRRVDRVAIGIQRDGDGFALRADLQGLAKGHLAARKGTGDRRDQHRQAQAKRQQGFEGSHDTSYSQP